MPQAALSNRSPSRCCAAREPPIVAPLTSFSGLPMPPPLPPSFTTRPVISGTFGVVSSTHWLASQVGMAVLEKGGNAFDAAAAAGFMLQVVEPHMNGLGGDAV